MTEPTKNPLRDPWLLCPLVFALTFTVLTGAAITVDSLIKNGWLPKGPWSEKEK